MIRCKSCQAAILWVRTEAGALIPLDAEYVLDGTADLVLGLDGIVRSVPVGHGDRVSHFAVCPGSAVVTE